MAYRKRTSPTLDKAQKRSLALKSIDLNLDLGNGLTVLDFSNLIDTAQQKIDHYNLTLAGLTPIYNEMMECEKLLGENYERMLSGVLAKYGRNSIQYEMAGGRKRAAKRKPKATSIDTLPIVTISTPKSSATPQALNATLN